MVLHRRIIEQLNVTNIQHLISEGVTFPIRCNLSNGETAVVKYPKNPAGLEALVNEWIGYSIADLINLSIPRYGICDLSSEVIEMSEVYGELDGDNSGISFFTENIGNTAPYTPLMLKTSVNSETERLILFDHLVKNKDRHDGNLIVQIDEERRVYFIDCSHILTVDGNLHIPLNLEKELSREEILSNDLMVKAGTSRKKNIYELLCDTMGFSENELLKERDRIKSLIGDEELIEIKESIPEQWCNANINIRIDNMFAIIKKRLDYIDDICDMIIYERRRDK